MRRTIGVKALLLIPELFLVTLGSFFLVALVPGNPAQHVLGISSTPAEYHTIEQQMGLNRPLLTRYFTWLGHAVQGNLGQNLVPPVEKVTTRLFAALPINLELAGLALLMALLIAIPIGMISAYRPGSRFDHYSSASAFAVLSVPSFLAALLLLLVFAINWHVFPVGTWVWPSAGGWGQNLYHAFLPAFVLALTQAPAFSQLLRSDMIQTLQEDYILAARAKGMPTWHILLREALKPSSFSLITLAGLSVGALISGTFIVEGIFGLQGLGYTLVNAVETSDYPLVQGGVVIVAVFYIVLNLGVDLLYAVLDPRVRRGRR
jgi:peptide/nickel transport system permease protein